MRSPHRSRWSTAITLVLLSLSLSNYSSASSSGSTTLTTTQSNNAVACPLPPTTPAPPTTKGGNPVTALAGYVKTSFLQFRDGSILLYTNHKQCNAIRAKQRTYIASKQLTMPINERRRAPKYFPTAGGITYGEFDFLQKGKDDRMKVMQLGFMMVYASRFVPYAFMFFPDMLPSPFRSGAAAVQEKRLGLVTSKWDAISRERAHAVVSTLLSIERDARMPSKLLKLNPFGHGQAKRTMARLEGLGHYGAALLATQGLSGVPGAETIMKVLREKIYTVVPDVAPKRSWMSRKDRTGIKEVPKVIVRGVARLIDAPHFNSLLPGFLLRGKVINHLQILSDADEFLVSQDVDLDTLSGELLLEACNRRLIGGQHHSDETLRAGLASWLELSVREPTRVVGQTGLEYNANLARLSLLCYHAVDGARDARASSYLPRLLFQGQVKGLVRKNDIGVQGEVMGGNELNGGGD